MFARLIARLREWQRRRDRRIRRANLTTPFD